MVRKSIENNAMTVKYIYLSDNNGRRSGIEKRQTYNSYQGEENRSGTDRRTGKDRRKTLADRRSRPHTSYEGNRRRGQERRGIPSILIEVDGI